MSEPKFKIGELVRLKCSYTTLVIENYRFTLTEPQKCFYKCVYIDNQGIIREYELRETSLREF
jgi:hypothetical protein